MVDQLRILVPASDLGETWSKALCLAAHARGWDVSWAPIRPDMDRVVQITSDIEPDDLHGSWIVMTDDPRALWMNESRRLADDHPPRDVLLRTSIRLATASRLVQAGALSIPAASDEIDLPHLGRVRRQGDIAPSAVDDPALDVYATLPPPVGASTAWGVNLFSYPVGKGFDGGTPDMDLTGRARILVHGPHLQLPEGTWEARLMFGVDPEGSPIRFRFDWGLGEDFVETSHVVSRSGLYGLTLRRRWLEPGPAQARIWLMQGAFQGRFDFQGCTVLRVADDATADQTPSA